MTFKEFLRRSAEQNNQSTDENQRFHYLNQSLVAEMGPKMLEEYSKFSLQTAALYKVSFKSAFTFICMTHL